MSNVFRSLSLLIILASPLYAQSSVSQNDSSSIRDTNAISRRLASPDALERQRAAEELAVLAAVEQRKLVAGYRLQEKNARVRLALDWALYRMGKNETLYQIVRDLDTERHNQSYAYLTQLESPALLYQFLPRLKVKAQARLLEVLARIGDAETIERIRPFVSSSDEKVADAARFAITEITARQNQTNNSTQVTTRPRSTGVVTEEEP